MKAAIGVSQISAEFSVLIIMVQSDDLSAIPLIIGSLIERINSRNNETDATKSSVSISSDPPIEGILDEIEKHHQLRQQFRKISEELQIRTCQMRLFERRFATKLQERSLRALDGILMLLEKNHMDVSKTCSEIKTIQSKIRISQITITGLLNLFQTSFVKLSIPVRHLETVRGVFAATVFDSTEHSWEEMIQPTVTYLISNGPFRSGTEISTFDEKYIFTMDEKFHFDQFKKQLTSLLSRIGEKQTKSGRSSADFEDLEELTDENDESISEWANNKKFNEMPV